MDEIAIVFNFRIISRFDREISFEMILRERHYVMHCAIRDENAKHIIIWQLLSTVKQ